MKKTTFEWNNDKDNLNQKKHGISFSEAQYAFFDADRIIAEDIAHSYEEKRYYCFGKVDGNVMTVRFTYRGNIIRIIGAGYWRQGRRIYDKAQKDKILK